MLRSLPVLRWSCEACRVLPCSFSSGSSNGGSKGASSDGPPDQLSKNEAEKIQHPEGSGKGKKLASQEEVKSKLAGLLSSLRVEGRVGGGSGRREVELASHGLRRTRKPGPLPPARQALKQQFQAVGPSMAKAVQSVAEEVGGGEETQKQLLESLERVRPEAPQSTSPEAQSTSPVAQSTSPVAQSTSPVAQSTSPVAQSASPGISSSPEDQSVSSEHAGKLKSMLSGLSVEKRRSTHTSRRSLEYSIGLGLFEAEPLNIFPPADDTAAPPPAPLLPTWEAQAARDLQLCTARPPDSHFQELMGWTEQGKVWQFPINNEFGMDAEEESKVGFQDHIFLERHLSPWCPKKGPIAHFMELVCVGLSRNPYITAQRKKDTIFWYRDYFESKKKLLVEIGAVGVEKSSGVQKEA